VLCLSFVCLSFTHVPLGHFFSSGRIGLCTGDFNKLFFSSITYRFALPLFCGFQFQDASDNCSAHAAPRDTITPASTLGEPHGSWILIFFDQELDRIGSFSSFFLLSLCLLLRFSPVFVVFCRFSPHVPLGQLFFPLGALAYIQEFLFFLETSIQT